MSRISLVLAEGSTTIGISQMWHQPKDENTLMLHMTMMTVISFSMKYLKSSYAILRY